MVYRDESEALRARIRELEHELGKAQRKIARLQGKQLVAELPDDAHDRLLGAPLRTILHRQLPFAVTREGREAIATLLRSRLGRPLGGNDPVTLGEDRLSYRFGGVVLTLEPNGRATELALVGDHKSSRTLLIAGVALAGAGVAALLSEVAPALGLVGPYAAIAFTMLTVACWALLRRVVARTVNVNRRQLCGVFESVSELATQRQLQRIAEPATAPPELAEDSDEIDETDEARQHAS